MRPDGSCRGWYQGRGHPGDRCHGRPGRGSATPVGDDPRSRRCGGLLRLLPPCDGHARSSRGGRGRWARRWVPRSATNPARMRTCGRRGTGARRLFVCARERQGGGGVACVGANRCRRRERIPHGGCRQVTSRPAGMRSHTPLCVRRCGALVRRSWAGRGTGGRRPRHGQPRGCGGGGDRACMGWTRRRGQDRAPSDSGGPDGRRGRRGAWRHGRGLMCPNVMDRGAARRYPSRRRDLARQWGREAQAADDRAAVPVRAEQHRARPHEGQRLLPPRGDACPIEAHQQRVAHRPRHDRRAPRGNARLETDDAWWWTAGETRQGVIRCGDGGRPAHGRGRECGEGDARGRGR